MMLIVFLSIFKSVLAFINGISLQLSSSHNFTCVCCSLQAVAVCGKLTENMHLETNCEKLLQADFKEILHCMI